MTSELASATLSPLIIAMDTATRGFTERLVTELPYLLAKHGKNGFQFKGEVKGMEVSFCFEDDNAMRCYLEAKKCMEDELDEELCHYECIGRLSEAYLDTKKGEKEIYDSDELD